MVKAYDGGIHCLLDCRFDFLLLTFMQEYDIKEKDIKFIQGGAL